MKRHPSLLLIVSALTGFGPSAAAWADEPKDFLDCAAKINLLDSHFSKYGHVPAKTILRDAKGFRFRLPAAKNVEQTGVHSFFALAGDFEVSATYEIISLPIPSGGYGASCGIAVDLKGAHLGVHLQRCQFADKRNGYQVNKCEPEGNEPHWVSVEFEPTLAKVGRLALRREKADIICLVADSLKEPLRELCRVKVATGTIRQLRIVADTGGAATGLDMRIGDVQVRAEEITGGAIPRSEMGSGWWWWLTGAVLVVVGAVVVYRWYRRQAEE